jgi:hypothetical protein
LHAQATIDLGVAGHQRGCGEGFSETRRNGGGILRAFANRAPGVLQPHQHAAHTGCLQQEAQQDIVGPGIDRVGIGHLLIVASLPHFQAGG